MPQKTALLEEHKKLNARIVEFAGWEMPVQYEGVSQEHDACRNHVGLFDVSHMGEVLVQGDKALDFLNSIVTNNVSKIKDNQAQYTVMCYESGGCVDDLIIHRFNEKEFFICVNASNTQKDFNWIKEHAPQGIRVENVSHEYTQIAIQGRHAQTILQPLTKTLLSEIRYYWFQKGEVLGTHAIIARTGYTGEDGFELYVPWEIGPKIWWALLEAGKSFGIKPCGLGARDTLRTEMKYPLYGHEIDAELNPLEAGLGWVVKLDKQDFIGKKALQNLTIKKTLVGLKSLSKAIPRQGYVVEPENLLQKSIGKLTSGTLSPSLKAGIGIAYVEKEFSKPGTKLNVVIRDQRMPHVVVEPPFYKRPY